MVQVDLGEIPVREANELIRDYAAKGENVEVINPDARHHIGVGLSSIRLRVHVKGSAGYFCAGLADQANFVVDNNVGWGLGDNMYAGTVTVHGNAGAIAGVAIRGAEIVVHGNVGSRAGQVMKEGTLCCVGNANFMAGYMMYGGRIIILGDSGERVGEDMSAGEIYVGGARCRHPWAPTPSSTDIDAKPRSRRCIREFLDRHEINFKGTFQKVVNAGKRLRYATSEQQVRSIPFFTFSGTVRLLEPARSRRTSISSPRSAVTGCAAMAARATLPHFSDLAFKQRPEPAPAWQGDPVAAVEMRTDIGGINGAKPLSLSMPADDRADELWRACPARPSRRSAWPPAWPASPRTPARAG